MVQTEYSAVRNLEVRGFFVSRVKAFVALFVFVSLVVVLIVLAALLAYERGKENSARVIKGDATGLEEESSLTSMSCDVVVVGGGISGMYMAETLVRMKKETNVCLFEKDSRFGGRDYDVRFSQAPNIAISLGAWRVDKKHKKIMDLARRFKIPMLKMGHEKVVLFEARGFYASNLQSLKEQAFPTLLSGPFANMTSSELYKYAWLNITREKALEVPSYRDFLCQKLGSEGCELLFAKNALKREYGEGSTLDRYESNKAFSYFHDYVRPAGGLSDIANAVERSAKRFGVKMYAKEKVKALKRKENMFVVQTDNFTVSTKKLVIAAPSFAFKEITGDVAAEIKSNPLFEGILPHPAFKAAAIYSYPWWENVTSSHYNLTLKPFEIFRSAATCLVGTMPYSGRGPQGEAVIQLSYAWEACATEWGELSKLSKAVFETELKKAVQEVFPGVVIPEPLGIVFKYWEEVAWHLTKAGSILSKHDLAKWAKRPFPGEQIYMVGEAYSISAGWNEGALMSAYNALKEGWEIEQPEPY